MSKLTAVCPHILLILLLCVWGFR